MRTEETAMGMAAGNITSFGEQRLGQGFVANMLYFGSLETPC